MFITRRLLSKSSLIRQAAASAKVADAQGASALGSNSPQVTKLPNELVVASLENNSPVSRIAIAVKAGSRYEPADVPGVAHALRNVASLGTKELSSFSLNRSLEQLGCNLSVSATRDHLYYVLEGSRKEIDDALPYLAQVVCEPSFKHWEVNDARPRLAAEISLAKQQPEYRLIEQLHKIAYRDSLRNSLLMPKFGVNQISSEMISEYWKENFLSGRIAVAGLGIDHNALLEFVDGNMSSLASGKGAQASPRYGGGQLRKDTVNYLTYAAVAAEGVGKQNHKEALAAQVLQAVLGPKVQWWALGEASSKLVSAAHGVTQKVVGASALNIAHADTGLFGFSIVAPAKDAGAVIKSCVKEIKNLAASGVTEAGIGAAKEIVKTNLLFNADHGSNMVLSMASQALRSGQVLSAEQVLQDVDAVSAADINNVLKKVTASKLSYSAVGNLSHLPFLEDIQ